MHDQKLRRMSRDPRFQFEFVFLDLLAAALVQHQAGDPAPNGNSADGPPAEGDHAPVQPDAVPVAADDGSHGAEARRDGLADAVDGAQDGWVRAAVVEQDDAGGQGHGAGRGVQEEDEHDAEPKDGGRRGGAVLGGGLRHDGQERREQVRDGEDDEEVAERPQRAQARVHRSMPKTPRIDVALPTVDAGMPRPPANQSRLRLPSPRDSISEAVGMAESTWAGAKPGRGDDRNSDQMLVKAPRWKS
ncbi:hypothetical protein N8I77_006932 [Diaporthe amygdali]|uniref:Uncharacterized protein n=1 Tax=Phomopsis amygdali TaxID=1214568 RepID=A0AAD9SIS2_PHOAM|nr:hypothetical protein N8I77_006932 [Diaporthe amygdali]